VARNCYPGNPSLQNFTCQTETASPKFPLGVIASQPVYRSIQERFQRITTKQITSPGTQLLPLLLCLISLCPSILVTSRFTIHKSERPGLHTSEAPIQKVRIKLSHAPFLPLPRLHPTSLRFSSRALPLLSLHYHCHIPRNHLSFTQTSTPAQQLTICSDNKFHAPRNCRHG
jgi:hypothetical protein